MHFRILQGTGLTVGAVDGSIVDSIDDIVGVLAVHGAAHRLGRAQHLLHGAGELLGHGPGPHHPRGVDDVVHGDVPGVLDVLDLLPVPRWLLEGLDDEGGGGGHHGAGGLPVLDLQLDGDLEALPLLGGLGDVVSDLLGGQTEGTDLGGQGAGEGVNSVNRKITIW